MRLSDRGLKLLKELEGGFQSKAYKDAQGFSIGYGHFILLNESHLLKTVINENLASVLLKNDVIKAEKYVLSKVGTTLRQNQFDALVIFVYNIGSWGSAFDTLLKSRKYDLLIIKWREYIYSNKKINNGLITRREKEIQLFQSNYNSSVNYVIPFIAFLIYYCIR